MAGYRLAIRSKPAEVIRHLSPDIKRAVRSALRALAADPGFGERLHAELEGLWKYRVRRFRLVYRVDRKSKVIDLVAVGERRGIYEEIAERLRDNE